jgi:hypothetical protein
MQGQHTGAEAYSVTAKTIAPTTTATGLAIKSPIGAATGKTRYGFKLQIKELRHGTASYTYFDWAKAERN